MAIGWYIAEYKRREEVPLSTPKRYCAMDDYTAQIYGDGGQWTESEVLGNRAVVKVRAEAATLAILDSVFMRLPKDDLDAPLADLSNGGKMAIDAELLDMGYSASEIDKTLGADIRNKVLGDVLAFMTKRRLKPRYDTEKDEIILDGPVQACRLINSVDTEVVEA